MLEHWNSKKRRALHLKSASYQIIDGVLFRKKNYDRVFLKCLEREDAAKVMKELHDGPDGGKFLGDTTAHKILRAGYYWLNLFKYAHAYVRKCETCQRSSERQEKAAGPLQPVIVSEPFKQ